MAAMAPLDEVRRVIATALDGAFYRAVYPDLAVGDVDPVAHYVASGWREGRDPAPWFSTADYVKAHPDAVRAGWNPLHHYLIRGTREGREITRSKHADAYVLARTRLGQPVGWRYEALFPPSEPDPLAEAALNRLRQQELVAAEFDEAFYGRLNPDVLQTDVEPLDHFMGAGWREGRDPNPSFSIRDYLETYPDIAQAGINPFVHYLETGRAEGRSPRNELGFRYEIIKRLAPLEDRVAAVARASARLKTGTASTLSAGLEASRTGLADLHVTFSHDDYTANTGGVQLCLQREDARIAALGRDHLHLYPAKPWPVVRTGAQAGVLGVLLNGRNLGNYAPETVVEALGGVTQTIQPGRRSFAIHSLLGHSADETSAILGAMGLSAGYFWLHDFASLCAGYHLLRNDVQDCAAPPPDSAACGICVYGPWRGRHLAEHQRLFERLALTVVSPSQPTLDLWRRAWSFPAKAAIVHPHAQLSERGDAPHAPADRPLRIAFAGMPTTHKGWQVFAQLVGALRDDGRYQFLHLGGRTPGDLPVAFHKVVVTEARPKAMQDTMERLEVDAVLLWPLCRETFSFTAYEAVAAGAAVITGPDSGNIAAFVEASGQGRVFPDEAALAAAFERGDIAALSRAARRPKLYDLAFSGLTVDLIEAEPAA